VSEKEKAMRLFVFALMLSLAASAVASAQTATPDSEGGRYTFNPVTDGVLRLDTRTGQVSLCSRNDLDWACRVVPDERPALETEIARLQGENATLGLSALCQLCWLAGREHGRTISLAVIRWGEIPQRSGLLSRRRRSSRNRSLRRL
jgi:hypothetical protein